MGHQAAPGSAEIQQQQPNQVSTQSTLMMMLRLCGTAMLLTQPQMRPDSVYNGTIF